MITKKVYEIMKKQYWMVWSRAIRWEQTTTPRSNTNDMSRVDDIDLLSKLNTWYVFIWLNWSSTHWKDWYISGETWSNFHSWYSLQNDYKLRYALKNTKYWGSYMTDLIKYYPEVDSNKVANYLKTNPEIIKKNIEYFEKEIAYLWNNLKLVALGNQTYELLKRYLWNHYVIFSIKHYSYTIWKEKYRNEVLSILN